MVDPNRSRDVPSYSANDLGEIRRFSKISSWIWSIISEVVIVLGRPGRGASQVEKSPCLNCATQFLTVAYDGVCSRFCQNGVNIFLHLALRGKKNNLMTAHVSMLLKSLASPDILPVSLCNKKILVFRYMNRPIIPTTLSIPSYDIGNYVELRTYQYPFVHRM